MPRGRDEVRQRLQEAALELYRERGFDQTTTAEIAARAGVTERTFFRHFPDKREVFFDGEAQLIALMTEAVAAAPSTLTPWETLFLAFCAVEPLVVENRELAESRREVMLATPALLERQLAKSALLTSTLASALQERGIAAELASLAAQTGMAALTHAMTSWRHDPSRTLRDHLTASFHEVHALSSAAKIVGARHVAPR